MYQGQINAENIHQLIRPLVLSGVYKNEMSALKDIIVNYINGKISNYSLQKQKFNIKYKKSFDDFTKSLKGNASFSDEDDWMDWRAAIEMEKAWEETLRSFMKDAN